MADVVEDLFDDPYYEHKKHRGGSKYASVAFLAEQGLDGGMSLDEVAEELGKSPAAVAHALRCAGVSCLDWERECAFRRGLFGPVFRATDAQAAEICNVSRKAITEWRHRNGIAVNPVSRRGARHG